MRASPGSSSKQVQFQNASPSLSPRIRRGEPEALAPHRTEIGVGGLLSCDAAARNVGGARIHTYSHQDRPHRRQYTNPVPDNAVRTAQKESLYLLIPPSIIRTSASYPCGYPCRLARALAPSRHMLISRTGHFGCSVISCDATRMGRGL